LQTNITWKNNLPAVNPVTEVIPIDLLFIYMVVIPLCNLMAVRIIWFMQAHL
jgi:hypothetical protein